MVSTNNDDDNRMEVYIGGRKGYLVKSASPKYDMPNKAFALSKEQVLALKLERLYNHQPKRDLFVFQGAPYFLMGSAFLTGALVTSKLRRHFRIRSAGWVGSYILMQIMPMFSTSLIYIHAIQRGMVKDEYQCPVCLPIKSGCINLFTGWLIPTFLATISSFHMARVYTTSADVPRLDDHRNVLKKVRSLAVKNRWLFGCTLMGQFTFAFLLTAAEQLELRKVFLNELLIIGTVRGFKHFVTYLKGKEELVLSVVNSPMTNSANYAYPELEVLRLKYEERIADDMSDLSGSGGKNLPYDKRSLLLSLRTQRQLSRADDGQQDGVGLPPASPSDTEIISSSADNSTLFLLAGYTRYKAPYVWVRSNHQRLMALSGVQYYQQQGQDWPLNLTSINSWITNKELKPWHVIAEIVRLCTVPSIVNPFEVDMDYFKDLTPGAAIYATAAMLHLLALILKSTRGQSFLNYAPKVVEDTQLLHKAHFKARELLKV